MGSCGADMANENKRREYVSQPLLTCPSGGPIDIESKPNEMPIHVVKIKSQFQVQEKIVTIRQFKLFLLQEKIIPSQGFINTNKAPDNFPVYVTVDDARKYVQWVNKTKPATDLGIYRLLSEAEWEYAARAGSNTRFYWGNKLLDKHAACLFCNKPPPGQFDTYSPPMPPGKFPPNAFGLYDMAGLAPQIVEDCWHQNYVGAPTDGSAWRDPPHQVIVMSGKIFMNCSQVARGGNYDSPPVDIRPSARRWISGDYGFLNTGAIRLARTMP